MPAFKNIAGQRFGRLTATRRVGTNEHRQSMWLFGCACGNEITAVMSHAISGHTQSCGCLHLETLLQPAVRHGQSRVKRRSREYEAWAHMLRRCRNENDPGYKNYGGRGITVCERWNTFENFLADIGPKPSPRHTLDRIDNNGNYELGNCRGATRIEQANNKRNNHFITIRGRTLSIAEWARELDFLYKELCALVDYGEKLIAKMAAPARREGVRDRIRAAIGRFPMIELNALCSQSFGAADIRQRHRGHLPARRRHHAGDVHQQIPGPPSESGRAGQLDLARARLVSLW
jgi:hypothetical protein